MLFLWTVYTTFKTAIIGYDSLLVVTTLFKLFLLVCNDITALSFFFVPPILYTSLRISSLLQKRKLLELFRLHYSTQSLNLIVMFLTLRAIVSILNSVCDAFLVSTYIVVIIWYLFIAYFLVEKLTLWYCQEHFFDESTKSGYIKTRLKTMRRNLSFEERAYHKKKENSSSSSSSRYNSSIEDCPYDEPDHIKNKVSLYCLVVLVAYPTMKLRKTISFKLPLVPWWFAVKNKKRILTQFF